MANALPGELLLIGFDSLELTPALDDWVRKRHVGGVILFSRNLRSLGQTARLIDGLQRLRREVSDSPLLIAIDQEGGVVSRHLDGLTPLPGNMALGALGTEDSAYAAGHLTAIEMGFLGCNINLAPVADVNIEPSNPVIGVRSFGDEPGAVAKMTGAMVRGLQENGMLATAKHFPGLGRCRDIDPHQDLPRVEATVAQMKGSDLLPFRLAIARDVAAVMTSHAVYPRWTPEGIPATLSSRLLQEVLRGELGFKGLVLSDDIEMGALTRNFTVPEIAQRSLEAGVDMLCVCHGQENQLAAYRALGQMAKRGKTGRLQEALGCVQRAKARIRSSSQFINISKDMVSIHGEIAKRLGRGSIVLHRDAQGVIPLRLNPHDRILLITPELSREGSVEEMRGNAMVLAKALRGRHPNTESWSWRAARKRPVAAFKPFKRVLLCTHNVHRSQEDLRFARNLLRMSQNVVVIALREPYDLFCLQEAKVALATLGYTRTSLLALVEILFGDTVAHGTLPVGAGKAT